MQMREPISQEEQIRGLNYFNDGDEYILRWVWPSQVESVFIYKLSEKEAFGEEGFSIEKAGKQKAKLYTKAEYKEFGGCRERVENIGKYVYYIFPYVKDGDTMTLVNQNNEDNRITLCTGRIAIRYTVKEKRKLFSNKKTVQIIVDTDVSLDKDILCYVKQTGWEPRNKEDGMVFCFIQDFRPGRNTLSDIEINKEEHIRLFFMNGKNHGEIYDLIRI